MFAPTDQTTNPALGSENFIVGVRQGAQAENELNPLGRKIVEQPLCIGSGISI